ncbi:hypothetical protein BKA65DRAFT_567230 [Rhexocercosporidium sp. MPI-PUGE-AT-0058]|nr:hypothetical protein BKA65DRAFT_567230 [Rhexocercosporidium sp. MPI-PUGE-AT-0058]
MANQMNQYGGGHGPGNVNPYVAPQNHGGGYIPAEQQLYQPQTQTQSPEPPSQRQPQYRPPPQPVHQSHGIAYDTNQRAPQSGFVGSKSAYTSAVEVDEYNDASLVPAKRPVHLKGIFHFFDLDTRFRFKYPHLYQLPAFQYGSSQSCRHRDSMHRVFTGPLDDRYLSPWDGHLAKLHVQATDELYDAPGTTTWRRTYIRSVAPLNVRIATWVIDFSADPKSWKDWGLILLRFVPASFALTFLVLGQDSMPIKYGLCYAPLPYKFQGYPKAARNQLENADTKGSPRAIHTDQSDKRIKERLLNPRYLCFLKSPEDTGLRGAVPMLVSTWQAKQRSDNIVNYLFVAYSTEQFKHESNEDMESLHQIAERATRDAQLSAYWVACSCMPDPSELEDDVYRISDIMRGAKAMAIAVGAPSRTTHGTAPTTIELLKHWGERMWTFPEVLLSQNNEVRVYARKGQLDAPLVIPKTQFAAQVWSDATVSRQLVEHYEGSLGLSRLELVTLALQCLVYRQTTQYLRGDHSYVLMGLLRLRPNIDRTDTAFQAFARLSLLNDSDLLLERVICTLPKTPNQEWYETGDAYGCNLWDIYPTCQVAGVGEHDTVIIDGAYGTSIRWKAFHRIWNVRNFSWKRWLAWKLLHCSSAFVLIGLVLIATGIQTCVPDPYGYPGTCSGLGNIGIGFLILLFGSVIWFMAPRLLRLILGGKFWLTQAAVFGFEGYMNLATIERSIFGGNFGRLSWSTNGSPLSRHHKNSFGECIGDDPTDDIEVRNLVEKAKSAGPGDQRIFTLVDTFSMEVTMFEASNPPIALVICGSEGGMKRAIGCSYDWSTGTLYRETVLRVKTTVLDRMDRVDKLKLGLKRPRVEARHRVAL